MEFDINYNNTPICNTQQNNMNHYSNIIYCSHIMSNLKLHFFCLSKQQNRYKSYTQQRTANTTTVYPVTSTQKQDTCRHIFAPTGHASTYFINSSFHVSLATEHIHAYPITAASQFHQWKTSLFRNSCVFSSPSVILYEQRHSASAAFISIRVHATHPLNTTHSPLVSYFCFSHIFFHCVPFDIILYPFCFRILYVLLPVLPMFKNQC